MRGGLTDFHNMPQTGLVDAAMLWPESSVTFKIAEVAPYMLAANLGAVNSKTVTANKDYWNTLPDEVKVALQEVSISYRDHLATLAMDIAAKSREAYVAAGGTIVEMQPDDRAAWAAAMPDSAVEWAKTVNYTGRDGNGMLRAYLAKLEAAGYVGIRDWTAGLSN